MLSSKNNLGAGLRCIGLFWLCSAPRDHLLPLLKTFQIPVDAVQGCLHTLLSTWYEWELVKVLISSKYSGSGFLSLWSKTQTVGNSFLLVSCFCWATQGRTVFIWERKEASLSYIDVSPDCLVKNGCISLGGEKGRDQVRSHWQSRGWWEESGRWRGRADLRQEVTSEGSEKCLQWGIGDLLPDFTCLMSLSYPWKSSLPIPSGKILYFKANKT